MTVELTEERVAKVRGLIDEALNALYAEWMNAAEAASLDADTEECLTVFDELVRRAKPFGLNLNLDGWHQDLPAPPGSAQG